MGKSSINWPCSIAMLVYQRVSYSDLTVTLLESWLGFRELSQYAGNYSLALFQLSELFKKLPRFISP